MARIIRITRHMEMSTKQKKELERVMTFLTGQPTPHEIINYPHRLTSGLLEIKAVVEKYQPDVLEVILPIWMIEWCCRTFGIPIIQAVMQPICHEWEFVRYRQAKTRPDSHILCEWFVLWPPEEE